MKISNNFFSKSVLLALLCVGLSSVCLQAQDEDSLYTPTVTSISIFSATPDGIIVEIEGTNFHSGCKVRFGEEHAISVVVTSSTSITAVAPIQTSEIADVIVTNNIEGKERSSDPRLAKNVNMEL